MLNATAIARSLLAAIRLFAGAMHLHSPGFFMRIVPDWVRCFRETILTTAFCEIFGADGLTARRTRRIAGWA